MQLPQQVIELNTIVDIKLLLRQHRNPINELVEVLVVIRAHLEVVYELRQR